MRIPSLSAGISTAARRRSLIAGIAISVLAGGALISGFRAVPAAIRRLQAPREVLPHRAEIYDRNGVLLASSIMMPWLYAHPGRVKDPDATASALAKALPGLNQAEAASLLSSDKRFVWLARHLTPMQQGAVKRLALPGLGFELVEERRYPTGALISHVVGFTNVYELGLTGIERAENERLEKSIAPLTLSIDTRVQQVVRSELQSAISDVKGDGGTGIVMDVRTGEIVAAVSLPDFDPNSPGKGSPSQNFNRATLAVYETGDLFNVFAVAGALETGRTIGSTYDTSSIVQSEAPVYAPLSDIFHAANFNGMARVSADIGADNQSAFLQRLGLTNRMSFEFKEIGTPLLPDREINRGLNTINYGRGLATTPMQVAAAFSVLVNGGFRHPPTLLSYPVRPDAQNMRALSFRTSSTLRALIGKDGVSGVSTRVKSYSCDCETQVIAAMNAFPIDAPQYVIYVNVDGVRPPSVPNSVDDQIDHREVRVVQQIFEKAASYLMDNP